METPVCQQDFCEYKPPSASGAPGTIVAGPDGAIWFAHGAGKIGRLTMDGQITEFPVPTNPGAPATIIPGSDGALWFVENLGNKIGRITTDGAITEINIPTPNTQSQ